MQRTLKTLLIPGLFAATVVTATVDSLQSSASAHTPSAINRIASTDVILNDEKIGTEADVPSQLKHHRGHHHHRHHQRRRRRILRHFFH